MQGNCVFEIAARNFVIASLVAFGAACKPHFPESPTPTSTLATIQIHYASPHTAINPRNTASLYLYAIDSEGIYTSVTNRAQWFSLDTAVVTVTNGTATGVAPGSTDVVASYQGLTATARIVVGVPPNLRIDFSGRSTREVGTFRAIARVGSGTNTRDVTDQVAWASSDPEIVAVNGGQVTAKVPGTVAITATLSGATTTTYLSIEPIRSLP